MSIHPLIQSAYKILDGNPITREEAIELGRQIKGEDLLDLISLANKVKNRFAQGIHACSIVNAKSGKCSQNCRFCAQSCFHHTQIHSYPLLSPEEILAAAKVPYNEGIRTFGYVTSGYGWKEPDDEFQKILDTFDLLHKELPDMKICASLGIMSEPCVKLLAEHHVWRYNMNLQTSPGKYAELIATTHTIEDKIKTILLMKKYGITNCTGGIIGLGESMEDRIDMAFTIRDLDVEGTPMNVLLPIPGTPLENLKVIDPSEVALTFSLFRLINPTKMIKFTAGRETVMKDFQGLLMLSGMNALMTGGYLTTRGRSIAEDQVFAKRLEGFSC